MRFSSQVNKERGYGHNTNHTLLSELERVLGLVKYKRINKHTRIDDVPEQSPSVMVKDTNEQ